ncbi:MAG: MerR family transcriptional regulator [Bacteroidetes bacterium]|mgnify:CR=1 FL=1|jgi:DNA-binding transcriptional MerR regulator|nr:MerR family transcriptional regulator [Bacteroidota bacterium]HMT34423.1 MerR family transcriptional regulator [Chitinophagaceae bacterium]MBK6820396.1 MerR family transcriptional regulator [Bacteroidota bacterium]MBK7041082.1 MerR family transcriptional regulator [Bacteroidota bacterium]MBK7587756.1 MerR family transcriptional regulator [Bacteroidota bacterium]
MEQLSLFEQVKKLQADKQVLKVDTSSLTKVYYTITEVAAMFGVNASLLRFWEKEFMTFIGQVKKNKKGDRYYNVQDIEKLKVLYHLIKERKMTLEGAREILKDNKKKVKDDVDLIDNLLQIKSFLQDLKKSITD